MTRVLSRSQVAHVAMRNMKYGALGKKMMRATTIESKQNENVRRVALEGPYQYGSDMVQIWIALAGPYPAQTLQKTPHPRSKHFAALSSRSLQLSFGCVPGPSLSADHIERRASKSAKQGPQLL